MVLCSIIYVTDLLLKMDESQDNEVANIYERMLKGDKNAAGTLHKLSNSPAKMSNKITKKEVSTIQQQSSQSTHDLNKARKSQNFRNYLREKVSQLRTVKQGSRQQLSKPDNQPDKKQFQQPKPFQKAPKRNQVKSEQKVTVTQPNKIQAPKVSKEDKKKTTSNNFQQKINKNIVRDSTTDKDKKSSPPSSKHSFRIRTQGGSKKLLEQLMKLNEEQRKLQSQILHLHTNTKQQIAQVFQKYKIKHLDSNYIQLNQKSTEPSLDDIDSPSLSFVKLKSQFISNEQAKIQKIKKQLHALNSQLQTKKTQIQKKQAKIEVLPLISYINANQDIFQQRESQQQNQQVSQLPNNNQKRLDPTKTYQSVMGEMRKKKWGLHQRNNYEYDSLKNNDSKIGIQKSPPKGLELSPMKVEGSEDNKIVVNSRLKQFLFE